MLDPYPPAGSNKCLHHHFLNPDPGMVLESPVICQTKTPKRVPGSGAIKHHVRQLDTGEIITKNCTGINTDLIGFHQGLTKGGVPENYRFTEIVAGMEKFISNP